jgi:hypothetical protein
LVPSRIGRDFPRCANHPERLAVGLCNDCGDNFCSECLRVYELTTRDANASLYLCPDCLRGRYSQESGRVILPGIGLLVMGALIVGLAPFIGVISIVAGSGFLVYGLFKRSEMPHPALTRCGRSGREERLKSRWMECLLITCTVSF